MFDLRDSMRQRHAHRRRWGRRRSPARWRHTPRGGRRGGRSGVPEADRAQAEMSTGQLRIRVRAYDREQAWAPPYVANELAATRQAAQQRRSDAVLRAAEADAAPDARQRDRLRTEAEQASALAEALDARVRELEGVDDARGHCAAHTAETRAAADRARDELSARQADADSAVDDHEVTPDQWVIQHQAEAAAEDPHRIITGEHELVDIADAREHD